MGTAWQAAAAGWGVGGGVGGDAIGAPLLPVCGAQCVCRCGNGAIISIIGTSTRAHRHSHFAFTPSSQANGGFSDANLLFVSGRFQAKRGPYVLRAWGGNIPDTIFNKPQTILLLKQATWECGEQNNLNKNIAHLPNSLKAVHMLPRYGSKAYSPDSGCLQVCMWVTGVEVKQQLLPYRILRICD